MINHMGIATENFEQSKQFYEAVLAPLGYQFAFGNESFAMFKDDVETLFGVSVGKPYPFHFAFDAPTHEAVKQFYEFALSNGGTDNGEPGYRDYGKNYYAAFIIDPDGYRIEAVCNKEGK